MSRLLGTMGHHDDRSETNRLRRQRYHSHRPLYRITG